MMPYPLPPLVSSAIEVALTSVEEAPSTLAKRSGTALLRAKFRRATTRIAFADVRLEPLSGVNFLVVVDQEPKSMSLFGSRTTGEPSALLSAANLIASAFAVATSAGTEDAPAR